MVSEKVTKCQGCFVAFEKVVVVYFWVVGLKCDD